MPPQIVVEDVSSQADWEDELMEEDFGLPECIELPNNNASHRQGQSMKLPKLRIDLENFMVGRSKRKLPRSIKVGIEEPLIYYKRAEEPPQPE